MKLGNFINIINGYAFNSNEFTNNINEYPVIKIKELKNNRILLNKDTCYIQYNNNLCNFVLKEGDIVIALTGNPPTKGSIDAMVGRCCRYNLPFPAFMNQRVCKVYSTSDKLLNKYLYYYLSLEDTILNLAQRCSGSANQANISSNDIKDLDITLPNLETQHHIVNTIGSVDDLIENYQKQIENICKILKNSLKIYTDKTTIDYYNPQIIKSGIIEFENEKIYLDTSSINEVNNITKGENITFNNRPSRANMLPTPNSVWFAKMKGSYKNLIITNMDHDLINKVILSTGFLGIEASKKLPLSLLTAFIISEQFNNQRDLNSVGTTMAGINNETFKKIEVPKLNYDEISKYELDYKNYIYQLSYLRRKIDKLLQIKSSLLAKYFN